MYSHLWLGQFMTDWDEEWQYIKSTQRTYKRTNQPSTSGLKNKKPKEADTNMAENSRPVERLEIPTPPLCLEDLDRILGLTNNSSSPSEFQDDLVGTLYSSSQQSPEEWPEIPECHFPDENPTAPAFVADISDPLEIVDNEWKWSGWQPIPLPTVIITEPEPEEPTEPKFLEVPPESQESSYPAENEAFAFLEHIENPFPMLDQDWKWPEAVPTPAPTVAVEVPVEVIDNIAFEGHEEPQAPYGCLAPVEYPPIPYLANKKNVLPAFNEGFQWPQIGSAPAPNFRIAQPDCVDKFSLPSDDSNEAIVIIISKLEEAERLEEARAKLESEAKKQDSADDNDADDEAKVE